MSQAKNKVGWCIAKAKKELETKTKHRGLREIAPDLEEAKKHLLKSEHNFRASLAFEKAGFSDWSASAAFYTTYHCLLAIAARFGFESRNQECTIALIEKLKEEGSINLSQEIIEALKTTDAEERHEINVISLREEYQYGTKTSIKSRELTEMRTICRQAIEEAKEEIYKG